MKKIFFSCFFLLTIQYAEAQENRRSQMWWTIYGQAQLLPGDVYISAKQNATGYGGGQTFLFVSRDKDPKLFWMGFDLNHHYFGRKQIGDYRVFYETWQLSFVSRFCFPSHNLTITPYVDLNAGLRLMESFTANNRTYGGLLYRRAVDLIAMALSENDDMDITDHKIIRSYGRLMPTAGVGAGCWLKGKKSNRGLSIKASVNFGTAAKYADYRALKTEEETYNYNIGRGSGRFYNFHIGYSFRD